MAAKRRTPAQRSGPAGPGGRRLAVMMDVARLAGVSHQTVSRVLNNHASVRPDTRERVLQAVRELDYQPNSAARTLVTRRSKTIGVVTLDSTLFGPASMLYGIEAAARTAGFFVSITRVGSVSRRPVLEAVNWLREQAVAGILAIIPTDSALAALADVSKGVPLVSVGGRSRDVSTVGVDNTGGAELVTRHLLELGHRTVHHIAGPVGWPEARHRTAGWRAALRSAGASASDVLSGDWSAQSGYEMAQRLAADPTVTAIFCANDHMALGALRAMSEAGRRVPDDISIVGFDDIPEAPFTIPPLTTVRQDFSEIGRHGLRLLLDIAELDIAEVDRPVDQVLLAPQLMVRASSGPTV